jgi:hypothetical protein
MIKARQGLDKGRDRWCGRREDWKIGGAGLQTSVRIQLVKYTVDAPVETSSEAQCAGVSHGMSRAVRSQRKAQWSIYGGSSSSPTPAIASIKSI